MAVPDRARQGRTAHAASGLTRALGLVLDPAARRRGFTAATLLADWRLIVGPVLAMRCQPTALEARGGVLHLQASSSAALEIQHAATQLIERVNTYFGYRAVRRMKLTQAPLPPLPAPPAPPRQRTLAPHEAAELRDTVAAVGDEPLQAALLALGHSLRSTRNVAEQPKEPEGRRAVLRLASLTPTIDGRPFVGGLFLASPDRPGTIAQALRKATPEAPPSAVALAGPPPDARKGPPRAGLPRPPLSAYRRGLPCSSSAS